MADAGIPHPNYTACGTIREAREAAVGYGFPVVLKADGLAAGKGVFICETADELEAALKRFYIEDAFGSAGRMVSVEQCLAGTEMSVFALCDGENVTVLGTAQDFKRAYDGDAGPNTGGMGSIAPSRLATDALMERVRREILLPTLAGMRNRGTPYTGFLYAGLMLMEGDPYVIEFNVRMGDPETQALLPLLGQPLYPLLAQALAGELPEKVTLKSGAATCVVLAAEGYPGSYEKGLPIGGLDGLPETVGIFHAGTARKGAQLVSSGGRVLNVVATGATISEARKRVYDHIPEISFPGSFYRGDIGQFNHS
jgi:phosphoribosylamine--glycine ligase